MAERKLALTTWQYIHDGEKQNAVWVSSVLSVVSPPPEPSGGVSAFPCDNATKIFRLPQNSISLAFNATKSQPHSQRTWRCVRHTFAKLAKERKETKEALWKFLRLDEIDKEVVIQPKVQRLRESLPEKEKKLRKFTKKPPPLHSDAWLLGVVPALRRAPNGAALWRCVGGSRLHAA
jgi:hypothetical protein